MALDFLILYEHVVREYESLLLLKAELEKRGKTVEIRQLLDRKKLRYFTYKKPKVLVSSCMYDNEAINSHVYNNVGKCDKIVNLHWEQMLSDEQEEGEWFNFGGNAKKCIQTCWGKLTSNRLVNHGMDEKNTPVTGAIMMDFLRPQFNGYFKNRDEICDEFNLDKSKKLMLYISSFGYASMNDKEVEDLSKMAGMDFSDFARVNRDGMSETLKWFDEYLSTNDDTEIIYRRHPSEWNSESLDEMCKKHKNFHVICDYSVKQWITICDSIYIWMSTAIAEVYFANKNCGILRPQPIPHEFDPVIYKNGKYITNYSEFLADTKSEQTSFPIEKEIVEGYFDFSETPAYIRTADLLCEVLENPPRDNPFDSEFTPHFNLIKYLSLFVFHFFWFIKLDPIKLEPIFKNTAIEASRIYGYIAKSRVNKKTILNMEEKIKNFI